MNRRMLIAALAALVPAAPAAVRAGETGKPAGVIELFTSQGCNSCPPADALLTEMAGHGDMVALAYHVDYWDYLGWRDTLASAENTARQYDYGKSFGIRSVYTPQAVLNGRMHVNGSNRKAVADELAALREAGNGMKVGLAVTRSGNSILIDAGDGEVADAHVVLVFFDPPKPVLIERGENRGRTVTYVNAVTGIQTAGMWHGKAARYELPASLMAEKGGCAVLLQSVGADGLPGPILGAALVGAAGG